MSDINVKGFSTFMLFAIPTVLGLAAIWWLAFGEGLHYFRRALSQEKRHAEVVGANPLPKKPMRIDIVNARNEGIEITRAEIDGGDLWIYYKNITGTPIRYIRLRWQLIAPDGTVVKAQEGFVDIYSENRAPQELDSEQTGEAQYKIPSDPRAVALVLKMRSN